MNLCIIGKFKISKMEACVTKYFSPIVNKNIIVPNLSVPEPFPISYLHKFVKFIPIKDEDKLTFTYILPYCGKDHKT